MDPPVIAALITAIVGPIVTLVATKAYERRFLEVMPDNRQKALAGTWAGVAHQEVGPDGNPLGSSITLELTTTRKTVAGTGRLCDQDYEARFTISGGFLHQRFLKLKYKNTDDAALHFGNITVEMSGDGRSLRGRYLGYGRVSERLVYGTVELNKKA